MSVSRFLDTNILIYLVDRDEPAKAARSREVLGAGANVISTQVLAEFYVTATRKLKPPLATENAQMLLRGFTRACRVVPADADMVLAAAARSQKDQLSLWDALIVEAARTAGCALLLSEDLQHGQVFDGRLRVQNPYIDLTSGAGRVSEGGPRRRPARRKRTRPRQRG